MKLIVEWFLAIVVAIAGATNSPALEQWADEFNADCFTDTCVGCVDDCMDTDSSTGPARALSLPSPGK